MKIFYSTKNTAILYCYITKTAFLTLLINKYVIENCLM